MFEIYHEKLVAYRKNTGWLQFYVMVLLPLTFVKRLVSFILDYFTPLQIGSDFAFAVDLIFLILLFAVNMLIRFLDKTALITTSILNFAYVIYEAFKIMILIIILQQDMDGIFGAIIGGFSAASLVVSIITFILFLINAIYFISIRKLFLLSNRQLNDLG